MEPEPRHDARTRLLKFPHTHCEMTALEQCLYAFIQQKKTALGEEVRETDNQRGGEMTKEREREKRRKAKRSKSLHTKARWERRKKNSNKNFQSMPVRAGLTLRPAPEKNCGSGDTNTG